MAIVLAIPRLFDAVAARFALESTVCRNVWGRRELAQQNATGSRIVWYPGDESGALGAFLPPRGPGGNPRPLVNLDELVTCDVHASDASNIENERAQYQATRELFCLWLRAVHLAARGTYRVVSAKWLIAKRERPYGATIRVTLAVQAVIPDLTLPLAPVDGARASIAVAVGDVTEIVTIERETP